MMENESIAVIGAGVMGCDIALDLASYNYEVILKDLSEELLQKASEMIRKNFKFFKLMKKEYHSFSIDQLLSRIRFVTDYAGLEKAGMVIENVTENYQTKRTVYLELGKICGEDVIFGVNTSCLSITKIGALMPNPENVIGMHFLNPVPLKCLVEVVKGYRTSEATVEKTKDFLKGIGKTCVIVNDYPGFVTNRVLMLTINECIWVVQDRVAEAADVDKIFRLGFAHKMGPLATADLIGLDTILNSLVVLYESYNDPKFRPCPLLRKMVDAGLLGKKTGKGFFEYNV